MKNISLLLLMPMLLVVSACDTAPRMDGRFAGDFEGDYSAMTPVVNGQADQVTAEFQGTQSFALRVTDDVVTLELEGCSLPFKRVSGTGQAELKAAHGVTCPIAVGGSIGARQVTFDVGQLLVEGEQLTIGMRGKAPPSEEGASRGTVGFRFQGVRR